MRSRSRGGGAGSAFLGGDSVSLVRYIFFCRKVGCRGIGVRGGYFGVS